MPLAIASRPARERGQKLVSIATDRNLRRAHRRFRSSVWPDPDLTRAAGLELGAYLLDARRLAPPSLRGAVSAPGYQPLLLAVLCSSAAYWSLTVVVTWLAFDLTGSEAQTAFVAMPGFAFGVVQPAAGALADRMDRPRLLLTSQLAAVVAALAFTVVGVTPYWLLVLANTVFGFAYWSLHPTRYALTMDLVGARHIASASALNVGALTVGSLAPALAIAVLAAAGRGPSLLLGVAWGLAACLCLVRIREPRGRVQPAPAARHGVLHVARVVLAHPEGRSVCALTFAANAFAWPLFVGFPAIFAGATFSSGPAGLSLLVGAGAAGSIAASAGAALLGDTPWKGAWLVGGTAAFGLLAGSVAVAPSLALGACAMALAGAGSAVFESFRNTLGLLTAPPADRGAAIGVIRLFNSVMPAALLVLGFLAESHGVALVCVGSSALLALSCAAIWAATPSWRTHGNGPRGSRPDSERRTQGAGRARC